MVFLNLCFQLFLSQARYTHSFTYQFSVEGFERPQSQFQIRTFRAVPACGVRMRSVRVSRGTGTQAVGAWDLLAEDGHDDDGDEDGEDDDDEGGLALSDTDTDACTPQATLAPGVRLPPLPGFLCLNLVSICVSFIPLTKSRPGPIPDALLGVSAPRPTQSVMHAAASQPCGCPRPP